VARRSQGINPFYPLVVVAGVAFVVTACAYGVMALKAMSPADADAGHPLLAFLDTYGVTMLGIELGLLAATSLLAMGTDQYWTGRSNPGRDVSAPIDSSPSDTRKPTSSGE
jgi:hypothetical protein